MDPLRRERRQSADALVHRLARVGIELGYDREGVVALDDYIEANRALWSSADRERLAVELAAFVGECIVETYALPASALASPSAWVQARLAGDERLTACFDRLGTELVRSG